MVSSSICGLGSPTLSDQNRTGIKATFSEVGPVRSLFFTKKAPLRVLDRREALTIVHKRLRASRFASNATVPDVACFLTLKFNVEAQGFGTVCQEHRPNYPCSSLWNQNGALPNCVSNCDVSKSLAA